MFDSKSPIVKVAGYTVIGFFLLIIIISFGMPDTSFSFKLDPSTAAVVNGKKLNIMDFARYRERMISQYPFLKDGAADGMILDRFISEELLYQFTQNANIIASDTRISNIIKGYFTSPDTGLFNADTLKNYLSRANISFSKFENDIRRELAVNDLSLFILSALTVPKNETKDEYICRNSKLQIRYNFLSKQEIRKRFANRLVVSDEDINKEIEKNPNELKDPQTDRERMKEKLIERRVSEIENELMAQVNVVAERGGTYGAASSILMGTQGTSAVFSIGESLKEQGQDGKGLPFIENSKVFKESCLTLAVGASSKVIQVAGGLYIFTPIIKQIDMNEPSADKLRPLEGEIQRQASDSLISSIIRNSYEKSKIIKNIKEE